jgi:hypothetical protein
LKAPVTKRLKVKYDDPLSILLHFCFNFAFNFSLRLYSKAPEKLSTDQPLSQLYIRHLPNEFSQDKLRAGAYTRTLVHFSA